MQRAQPFPSSQQKGLQPDIKEHGVKEVAYPCSDLPRAMRDLSITHVAIEYKNSQASSI